MIDAKQNRDLLIVYCDPCASSLKFYSRQLNPVVGNPLRDAIEAAGWHVTDAGQFGREDGHKCRACIRKGKT